MIDAIVALSQFDLFNTPLDHTDHKVKAGCGCIFIRLIFNISNISIIYLFANKTCKHATVNQGQKKPA